MTDEIRALKLDWNITQWRGDPTVKCLVDKGLLEWKDSLRSEDCLDAPMANLPTLTNLGVVMVHALCSVPIPEVLYFVNGKAIDPLDPVPYRRET